MTDVLIRRVINGEGNVLAAKFSVVLVDADGTQRVGWQTSTGKPITEYRNLVLNADSGDLTLTLIPQDDVSIDSDGSASYYRVRIFTDERTERWDVVVPDSVVTQELADLILT